MAVDKKRGDTVSVTISLKNTGASATKFSLAIEFDTMTDGYYNVWFNGAQIPEALNPNETQNYILTFPVPGDAPIGNLFAVSVFVYPPGQFMPSDPDANKIVWDSKYDGVRVIQGAGVSAEIDIISVD